MPPFLFKTKHRNKTSLSSHTSKRQSKHLKRFFVAVSSFVFLPVFSFVFFTTNVHSEECKIRFGQNLWWPEEPRALSALVWWWLGWWFDSRGWTRLSSPTTPSLPLVFVSSECQSRAKVTKMRTICWELDNWSRVGGPFNYGPLRSRAVNSTCLLPSPLPADGRLGATGGFSAWSIRACASRGSLGVFSIFISGYINNTR